MTKTPTEEAVESIKADLAETCPPGSRYSHALVNKRHLSHLLSELSRLQAERDKAVEALAEIADLGPATCEITLATTMAQLAAEAISTLPPPVKEAEPEPVAWADPADLKTLASDAFDVVLTELTSSSTAWNSTPLYATPPAFQARVEALEDIAAERRRQIEVEGWTPQHDDEHGDGAMAAAAASYALKASLLQNDLRFGPGHPPPIWPGWAARWWKPKSRRADLVRAGALIIAEIERLDRRAALTGEKG